MIEREAMAYYNALNDQERFLVDSGWKDAVKSVLTYCEDKLDYCEKFLNEFEDDGLEIDLTKVQITTAHQIFSELIKELTN